MPFISASKANNTGFTSASDVLINKYEEEKKNILQRTVSNVKEAVKNPSVILDRLKEIAPSESLVSKDETGQYKLNQEQGQKIVDTTSGFIGGGNVAKKGKEIIQSLPSKLKQKAIEKTNKFIDDLITPELTKKASETAIKTGKVVENKALTGARDIKEAVPFFNEMKTTVQSVKGLSPKKTLLENSNVIHDEIANTAESLKSQLKDKGFFSPNEFNGYIDNIKLELKDSPLIVGDSEKVAEKIVSKFNNLIKKNGYTPEGLLNARKELDSWMSSQKGQGIFDPSKENAISIALKAIRQGGNDFLAQRVPDVAVKDLLSRQSNLYSAIDNIAKKATKEGGNRLQRFIKANPQKVKAIKTGATLIGGGLIANEIFN